MQFELDALLLLLLPLELTFHTLLVLLVFGERSHQLVADASHTLTQGGCLRQEP